MKVKKLEYKILIAVILGMINALFLTVFIKNTTLYSGGTSAFFLGIGRFVRTYLKIQGGVSESNINIVYNLIYWGGYLLMNVPLFIFGYKTIGKHFAIISLAFVLSDRVSGFLLGFFGDGFTLDIFGTTQGMNTYVHDNYGLDVVYFNPVVFPGNNILDWGNRLNPNSDPWTSGVVYLHDGSSSNIESVEATRSGNTIRVISLFMYSLIFAGCSAFVTAILFIIGGSTAGSDFITVFYSVRKHKDIGIAYAIINTLFMISGFLIGNYMSGGFVWNDINSKQHVLVENFKSNQFLSVNDLFSANIVISVVVMFITGWFISYLFPSKKIITCEISSENNTEIAKKIFDAPDFSKVIPIKRPTATKHHSIRFICSYLAYMHVYQEIKTIDKNALIITDFVTDIDGPIDLFKNNFSNK